LGCRGGWGRGGDLLGRRGFSGGPRLFIDVGGGSRAGGRGQ